MSFYDAIRIGSSGDADFKVQRSLRFNHDDDPYLSFTPSSTGNRKVWTFSAWIKRTEVDNRQGYIYTANDGGSAYFALYFRYDKLYSYFDPGNNYGEVNDRLFRDLTGWFHLVHQVDAENTTQRIWINGVEMTLNSSRNPSNSNFPINTSGLPIVIGKHSWGTTKFSSMYLAEVHHSDGYKYTPTDYAKTDAETGQWIPKLPSILYGTNGFYLNFSDNSGTTATTLGKDSSGNGNNFTPNNFSVAAGAGNDSVSDTPTNNFCTFNPLDKNSNVTTSDGNLKAVGASGAHWPIFSTFGMKGGKWYVEYRNNGSSSNWRHAIMNIQHDGGSLNGDSTVANSTSAVNKVGYGLNVSNGQKMHDTDAGSSYGSALSGTSDVLQCAVDLDNGKIYWGINDTWFNSGDPAAGSNPAFSGIDTTITWTFAHHIYHIANCTVNFGQQGFTYTPPTGFNALSSANLPDPTILLPNKHFETVLYTGNNSTQSITSLQFKPDWLWMKNRERVTAHGLYDSVRGAALALSSDLAGAETTPSSNDALISFDANGFSLGANNNSPAPDINFRNTEDYVAWSWNGGDADSKTYRVVVVSDSGNKYQFRNSANSATFAVSAVTLNLEEGGTYIFNMDDSTNATHPFSIGTAANSTVYTSGITYFLDGVSKTYSEYTSGFASATTRRLHITVPASAPQLYYWCSAHSGMGGAINTNSTKGSSNFDGDVTPADEVPVVKANTSAGFSIISYTGQSGSYKVGHGLGIAPEFIITKNRGGTDSWWTHTTVIDGTLDYVGLNLTQAAQASDAYSISLPTSLTFGDDDDFTDNNSAAISYCFNSVAGFSKVGKYIGNGSSNGTFVFTGFRPAWVLVKANLVESWYLYDNKRNTFNVVNTDIRPNHNYAEASNLYADFLSNGFKVRATDSAYNQNGATYIYLAFAESPFKNSRAR